MVRVMVKVTLTFRVTIKLKVKITDFYGNGELRLLAATTNTRNPYFSK